jgi:NSS family neurotransmitter:Na+ symporter
MSIRESSYGYWSSTRSFIWVAAGAAMGIGNIVRLPYLMGEHGGVLFLLVYLAALVVVGMPLLVAEWMLGRWMRDDLAAGFRRLAETARLRPAWGWIGRIALVCGVLLLSYYSVIAGWSMAYAFRTTAGAFGQDLSAEAAREVFAQLAQDPERSLSWHTVFMVIVCVIVTHGFREGIERAALRLVPTAFTIAILLCGYAITTGETGRTLQFLLQPDFAKLGWRGVLEALHQAFFTLALGIGVGLALGSYLPANAPVKRLALAVLLMDTVFSLVIGLAVFALIFNAGLAPAPGLALLFQVLPRALPPGLPGVLFGVGVYMSMFLITLMSAAALLEPVTRYLMDRQRWTRVVAATSSALVIWYLGLGTLLSFSVIQEARLFGRNFFDWAQWLTVSVMAPVGGLLICVLVVSMLPRALVRTLWGERDTWLYSTWFMLLRYPARLGLILVLLYAIGLLDWIAALWSSD